MVNRFGSVPRLLLCLAVLASTGANAFALELLTNGNFEATAVNDRPPGWTLFEQTGSVGRFYLDQPGTTIPSGDSTLQTLTTPINSLTPGGGNQYAISVAASDTTSEQGPGAHALYQSFTLPGFATSVNIGFQVFTRDFYNIGAQVNAAGLDYTSGGTDAPNQQARVDILRGGASPLSIAPADLIDSFNINQLAAADSNWVQYNKDITSLVVPGQAYTIRFATVSNRYVIGMGVDNVSVNFIGQQVLPEPGSVFLFAPPALLLIGYAWHRKRS